MNFFMNIVEFFLMNTIEWFGNLLEPKTWVVFVLFPTFYFFAVVAVFSAIVDYQDWKELTLQDAEREHHEHLTWLINAEREHHEQN